MPRTRITIVNVEDRREQLRVASRVRTEVIDELDVWLDPRFPLQGVNRDEQGRPYMEFDTDEVTTVESFLRDRGLGDDTEVTTPTTPLGEACVKCGNIAGPKLPIVCPNCEFRDIEPCPICGQPVPRRDYRTVGGSMFVCPHPRAGRYHRVRLAFNEPIILPDGSFRQPLVVVSPVEE